MLVFILVLSCISVKMVSTPPSFMFDCLMDLALVFFTWGIFDKDLAPVKNVIWAKNVISCSLHILSRGYVMDGFTSVCSTQCLNLKIDSFCMVLYFQIEITIYTIKCCTCLLICNGILFSIKNYCMINSPLSLLILTFDEYFPSFWCHYLATLLISILISVYLRQVYYLVF